MALYVYDANGRLKVTGAEAPSDATYVLISPDLSLPNAAIFEYTFTQSSPLSTWVIVHNLNRHPQVTVVDSANSMVIGDIIYNSLNQITVSFSGAFSGYAYLS